MRQGPIHCEAYITQGLVLHSHISQALFNCLHHNSEVRVELALPLPPI